MKNKKLDWIAVSFGTCMGAGVLFLPPQVGLSGLWSFIFALPLVFVLSYFGQRYIADVVANYPDRENQKINYSDMIEEIFGKIGGKILIFLFFMIMMGIIIAYVTGFQNDLFAFFKAYKPGVFTHVTDLKFILFVTAIFGIILLLKHYILMYVMRFKSMLIMVLLFLFSLLLIPYWHLAKFSTFPHGLDLLKGILTVIPILITGTSFFGNVSEMAVDFKYDSRYASTHQKINRKVILASELLIFIFITFFVISSTLALSDSQLLYAAKNSQTAMSVLHIPGLSILAHWFGLIILPASFLGAYIPVNETLKKLFFPNYAKEIVNNTALTRRLERKIALGVIVFIFILLFLRINILSLVGLFISPIMCLLVFVIPVIMMIKEKKLGQKINFMHYFVMIVGVLLMLSYIVGTLI